MSPENFTYWLQGFVELTESSGEAPTELQWLQIRDHLKSVFVKVTPTYAPQLKSPYTIGDDPNYFKKISDMIGQQSQQTWPYTVTC